MTSKTWTSAEIHEHLQNNFQYFAKQALKIKDKDGKLVPFTFNRVQTHIEIRLQEQIKRTGRVRAWLLKGRQQGCSTHVGGRYYHKATRNFGKSVFILSHEAQTTEKLFKIVERFHENCPTVLKPQTAIQNRRQLVFADIESDYTVGTAGNEDVGRGGTIQYFHGSEVAFWKNTDAIVTGIFQSVPDLPGTEIILESTANGMGNFFYTGCMEALEGIGDYILIFVPWFWQEEYRREPPEDFVITDEEHQLIRLYNLDNYQLYWRRLKIIEFKGLWKFKQEYPCNVQEAFQTSGEGLINPEMIMEARQCKVVDDGGAKILGVDPGRHKDRSVLFPRQGRVLKDPIIYRKEETQGPLSQWEMRLAGIIARMIDNEGYDKVFIDCTKGYGTHDRLHELGYHDVVVGVNFSERSLDPDVYANKRAEIWCALRDFIEESGHKIPDSDEFHRDLAVMPQAKETSVGLTILESKDKIQKDSGFSTDLGDAAALTFSFPVRRRDVIEYHQRKIRKVTKNKRSGLRTTARMRGEKI